MAFITERLQQIYTAKMCSDLNDVEYALKECFNLAHSRGYTAAIKRRITSLNRLKYVLEHEKGLRKIAKQMANTPGLSGECKITFLETGRTETVLKC